MVLLVFVENRFEVVVFCHFCDLCDCDGGPRSGPRELNTKSRRKGINKVNSLNLAGLEDHEVVVIGESLAAEVSVRQHAPVKLVGLS